ncbi:hypothetical protein [Micromonospora sp. CA-246542]|uniref:hypothetical protein n=1 Tax=Micromonospora sp. CA-246542 TaxID=3239959 RepID=UPI003D89FE2D
MKISPVAKAYVTAVSSVVTALSAAFADDVLGDNEVAGLVSTVALAALGVYAVYKVPNKPEA